MWEFLIRQDSGLYKPKSIANLEFIEQYYKFNHQDSNNYAMLGEIIPYTYNGTEVIFENEDSLPDSGTYMPFVQNDCYNNSLMFDVANTVSDAKNILIDAITTFGQKLVRVIHVDTTIDYQPWPSPENKQDKYINTIDINSRPIETTIEDILLNRTDNNTQRGLVPVWRHRFVLPSGSMTTYSRIIRVEGSITAPLFAHISGYMYTADLKAFSRIDVTVIIPSSLAVRFQGYIDEKLPQDLNLLGTSSGEVWLQQYNEEYLADLVIEGVQSGIDISGIRAPRGVIAKASTDCVCLYALSKATE